MSLFDRLRHEIIDIIEWVDDDHHILVWRFPRWNNEIKNGAQLVVRAGQKAVFVHQGRVADVFEPGHYTLETKNLPVLSILQGWRYGFKSPFKAEVYFVNTRQVTDLKWGTPHPVMMRDPDFGGVRLRAFGTYALRVVDPKILLEQLVGTDGVFEVEELEVLLRSLICEAFVQVVGESRVAALDIAGNYAAFAAAVQQKVITRIDDEYGLAVPQVNITNVALPAEVEKALDVRSSISVIGDMQKFQQFQMGQAILATAEKQQDGGLVGHGVGLGVGMALMGQMGQFLAASTATGAAPPAAAASPATAAMVASAPAVGAPPPVVAQPAPAAQRVWHIAVAGQAAGPFDSQELRMAAAQGRLTANTLVWCAGMEAWLRAAEVAPVAQILHNEAAGAAQAQPPPLPPTPPTGA